MLALVLLGLVACTGPTSVHPSDFAPIRITDPAVGAIRNLLHNDPVLAWAQSISTAACMRDKGFAYAVGLSASSPRPDARFDLPGVVSIDLRYAAARGYGRDVGHDIPTGAASIETRYLSSLSQHARARYREALWGPHGGPTVTIPILNGASASAALTGCFARGSVQVFGSVRRLLEIEYLAQGIFTFQGTAWADDALRPNLTRYRRCMARDGIQANFPQDALGQAQTRFDERSKDEAASHQEVVQAMTDARCQSVSQIVSAYEQSLVRSATDWLVANRDALIATNRAKSKALRRARAIVDAYRRKSSGRANRKGVPVDPRFRSLG